MANKTNKKLSFIGVDKSLLEILYQEFGTDNDDQERKSYQLNPHMVLLPEALSVGMEVRLP